MKSKVAAVIKTTVILFLITAISALLLAFANSKTAPLIKENAKKTQDAALKTVLPGSEKFSEIKVDDKLKADISQYKCEIKAADIASDSSGKKVGVCVITTCTGYSSGLEVATGINAEGKVTDIEIVSSSETPGLGQKASKSDFKDQFKNKSADSEIGVAKSGAKDNEINAMSGATITSKAVTRSVNTAVAVYKSVKEELSK